MAKFNSCQLNQNKGNQKMLTTDQQREFDRILSAWENDPTQLSDEKRRTLPQNQSIVDELLANNNIPLTRKNLQKLGAADRLRIYQKRQLYGLQFIFLNNLGLTRIPNELFSPPYFQRPFGLHLSDNRLKDFSLKNVPFALVLYINNQFPKEEDRGLESLVVENVPRMQALVASRNRLKTIVLDKLNGDQPAPNFLHLVLDRNLLESLVFPHGTLPNLDHIAVSQNRLISVDLTPLPNLQVLVIDNNVSAQGKKLSHIEFPRDDDGKNRVTTYVRAQDNNLPLDEFSILVNLLELNVANNDISGKVDLKEHPHLLVAYFARNPKIIAIDTSEASHLEQLDVDECTRLAKLEFGNTKRLRLIWANDTELSELDLQQHPDLTLLHATRNSVLQTIRLHPHAQIDSIKIENNPQLLLETILLDEASLLQTHVDQGEDKSILSSQKSPSIDIANPTRALFSKIGKYFPQPSHCLYMLEKVSDTTLREELIREAALHFSQKAGHPINISLNKEEVDRAIAAWTMQTKQLGFVIEDSDEIEFNHLLSQWEAQEKQNPQSMLEDYEAEVGQSLRSARSGKLTWLRLIGLELESMPPVLNHRFFPQLTMLYVASNKLRSADFLGLNNLRALMLDGNSSLEGVEINLSLFKNLQRLSGNFARITHLDLSSAIRLRELSLKGNNLSNGELKLAVIPEKFVVDNEGELKGRITVAGKVYVPNEVDTAELAGYVEGFCKIDGKQVSDESFFAAVRYYVTDPAQQLYLLKTSQRIAQHIDQLPINRDDVEWFIQLTENAERHFPQLKQSPDIEAQFHELRQRAEHLLESDERELQQTQDRWLDEKKQPIPDSTDPQWTNYFKYSLEQWVLKGNPYTTERAERLEIKEDLLRRWQMRAQAIRNGATENELKAATHTRIHWANKLYSEVPEAISLMTWVEEIDLSNNRLPYLPESLYRLSKLKRLNVSNNPALSQLPIRWKRNQLPDDNFDRQGTPLETIAPAAFSILDNIIPPETAPGKVIDGQVDEVILLFEERFEHPRALFEAILAFRDDRIERSKLLERSAVIQSWLLEQPLPDVPTNNQTIAYRYLKARQTEREQREARIRDEKIDRDSPVLWPPRTLEDDLAIVTHVDREQFIRHSVDDGQKATARQLNQEATEKYEQTLSEWAAEVPPTGPDAVNMRYAKAAVKAILLESRLHGNSRLDLSSEAMLRKIQDGGAKTSWQRAVHWATHKAFGTDPAEPPPFDPSRWPLQVELPPEAMMGVSRIKEGDFTGCDFSKPDPRNPDQPLAARYIGMLQLARRLDFRGTKMKHLLRLYTIPACVTRLDNNHFEPKTRRLLREMQEANWRVDVNRPQQIKQFIEGPLERWRSGQGLEKDHVYYKTIIEAISHGAADTPSEVTSIEEPKFNLPSDGKTKITALPDELFSMLPSNLTRFSISGHALTAPLDLSELAAFTKLKDIDVSNNQLSTIHVSGLQTLTELESFTAEDNSLKELPDGVTALRLAAAIRLNGNGLSEWAKNQLEQRRLRSGTPIEYDGRDDNPFSQKVETEIREVNHHRQMADHSDRLEKMINRIMGSTIQDVSIQMIKTNPAARDYYGQCKMLVYSYVDAIYSQRDPKLPAPNSKEAIDILARIALNAGLSAGFASLTAGVGAGLGPVAGAAISEAGKKLGEELYQLASNHVAGVKPTEQAVADGLKTLIRDYELTPEKIENLSDTIAITATLMKMDSLVLPPVPETPPEASVIPPAPVKEKRFKYLRSKIPKKLKWTSKRKQKGKEAVTVTPKESHPGIPINEQAADDVLAIVRIMTSSKDMPPKESPFDDRLKETLHRFCVNNKIPFKPELFTPVLTTKETTNLTMKDMLTLVYESAFDPLVKGGIRRAPTGYSGTLEQPKSSSTVTRSSIRRAQQLQLERQRLILEQQQRELAQQQQENEVVRKEMDALKKQFETFMATVSGQSKSKEPPTTVSTIDTNLLASLPKKLRGVILTEAAVKSLEQGQLVSDDILRFMGNGLNEQYNQSQLDKTNRSYFVDHDIASGVANDPNYAKTHPRQVEQLKNTVRDVSLLFFPIKPPGSSSPALLVCDKQEPDHLRYYYYGPSNPNPDPRDTTSKYASKDAVQAIVNRIHPIVGATSGQNAAISLDKLPERSPEDQGLQLLDLSAALAANRTRHADSLPAELGDHDITPAKNRREKTLMDIQAHSGEYISNPWKHVSEDKRQALDQKLSHALHLPSNKVDLRVPETGFSGEVVCIENNVAYFRPYHVTQQGDEFMLSAMAAKKHGVDENHRTIDKLPIYGIPIQSAALAQAKIGDLFHIDGIDSLSSHQETQIKIRPISTKDLPGIIGLNQVDATLLGKHLTETDRQKLALKIRENYPDAPKNSRGEIQVRFRLWHPTKVNEIRANPTTQMTDDSVLLEHDEKIGGKGNGTPRFYFVTKEHIAQWKESHVEAQNHHKENKPTTPSPKR